LAALINAARISAANLGASDVEYVMLGGINDAARMRGAWCGCWRAESVKVNLIPWNPGELPYRDRLRNGLRSSGNSGGAWRSGVCALTRAGGCNGGMRATRAAADRRRRCRGQSSVIDLTFAKNNRYPLPTQFA